MGISSQSSKLKTLNQEMGITRRLIVETTGLTLEQEFKLKVLENHIQGLSQEQLQKLLLVVVRQTMIKND